jgi:hypothetical protein
MQITWKDYYNFNAGYVITPCENKFCVSVENIRNREVRYLIKKAYKAGIKFGIAEGLKRFAWWKDGVEYVGTCGTTLKDALKDLEDEDFVEILLEEK